MRWLDSITDSMNINLHKLREIVKEEVAWHAAVHGVSKRHNLATKLVTTTTKGDVSPLLVVAQSLSHVFSWPVSNSLKHVNEKP